MHIVPVVNIFSHKKVAAPQALAHPAVDSLSTLERYNSLACYIIAVSPTALPLTFLTCQDTAFLLDAGWPTMQEYP